MDARVKARRRQLAEWELDNAEQQYGAVRELRVEVEALRGALESIRGVVLGDGEGDQALLDILAVIERTEIEL